MRGQYVIEGLLGKSGSGTTYLVRDQYAMDAPSSLFVLKEVVEPNKQARRRLASEGKLLRRLHHPGLPRVHRVLNDDKNNRVYLLMDYIAGQDLETLRQQQHEKLFSWTEAMHIMAPIIAAVAYLHHQQPPIIHGDIKPANIIMSKEDSRFVLVDFGMMKAYNPGSTTTASRYCYRAPEQTNGSIDVRTDIYALGATFYTLVTAKLPPDATSRLAKVGDEAVDPLEPVNIVVPAIPMSVSKVIERAMSLNAQDRFSSVDQFWEVLCLILAEQPASVFDKQSVPKDSPDVPTPGLERAIGQTIEKPVPEPLSVVPSSTREQKELDVVPIPESIEEQEELDAEKPPPVVPVLESVEEPEDPDATVHLPKLPSVVLVPDSVEEREDPDATIRLPRLPPVVLVPDSVEEREELDVEKQLPVAPAGVKEQEDLDVVKPLPRPSGGVRVPISLRKLGVLFVVLVLLIGLGVGASFWSRARSHTAAHSAIPASSAASLASTPTSAPVASSYPILAGTYSGTIYDTDVNVSTDMFLTVTQQNQSSFSGYLRLGSLVKGSGPFRGTIDTTKILQFTVTDAAGNATLFFEGGMQSATSLSGDYYQCGPAPIQGGKCSRAPGGYGIWNVIRASSGSSSSLLQSSIAEVADSELYSRLLDRRQDKDK
jgi:serine/threonine protein kinase